jgi:2-keto-4-pentenoate hydratase/2-oxohepta-3-ene-1,7-dioic acid hydratase in catechol pathway
MRLCRFDAGGGVSVGLVEDGAVHDLRGLGPSLLTDAAAALAAGPERLADIAARAPARAVEEVTLLAPAQPSKFLGIGLNYADHIAESGMDAPETPIFFNKQVTCVVGPDADVHMPRVSTLLDYEGELAVVIGARCRHVPPDRAHEVIAGYTIANDLSVRDWQLRTPTMTMGKSFDTHGPLGPWLVTPDEIGDPHELSIRTYVNDELRQDGNTREMIYDCFQQVAHLSEAFTLEPGDVIATGTPAGVGAVRQPFPEGLLKVGDTVRVEIDRIGSLSNTVVEEPEGFVAEPADAAAACGLSLIS